MGLISWSLIYGLLHRVSDIKGKFSTYRSLICIWICFMLHSMQNMSEPMKSVFTKGINTCVHHFSHRILSILDPTRSNDMEEIPSSWCFMVCPGGFPPTVGFDPCQPILRACSVRHVMTYAVAGEKTKGRVSCLAAQLLSPKMAQGIF